MTNLIASLRSSAVYPHPVDGVELVETHISWVMLAGDFAYKVKKSVDFGFANFSTLDRRQHFCEEEVRLNRRLAPDLYLGVVAITGTLERPVVEGDGKPIEYAVKMRRFPPEAPLSAPFSADGLTPDFIDSLASEIAEFHGRIAVAAPDSLYGSPERIWQPVEENFEHLASGFEESLARRLADWSRSEFEARRDRFATRKLAGFVRECHGDMHLGNMIRLGNRVIIFDAIEFNDDLRWIDVISEVAFVVMDLEDRGRPELASRLLNGYLETTGDYTGLAVMPFYLVYRATVRAKVASIRARQIDMNGPERERFVDEGRRYLRLAERYSTSKTPALLVTHGVSGSGKTTVTQRLAESLGVVRVRADVERKRLFGLGPFERPMLGRDIYTSSATEKVYERLADLAGAILKAGFPVIVDATFLERSHREAFRKLAERLGVPFVLLDVQAEESVIRARVIARAKHSRDASDADLSVLERQLHTHEPVGEGEAHFAVTVRTDSPSEMEHALEEIRRRSEL